ncbi:MAG TPA: hypothetical protein DCQ06_12975, partial [Myxococcales bacterium]|nr:hypothetical protein [Myxococcales bacterium]
MQADRRQYARRQQALAVKIVKGNQERSELATNVSATGAFISGVKTPEAGAEIVLVVRPPGERIAPV